MLIIILIVVITKKKDDLKIITERFVEVFNAFMPITEN